MNLTAVFQVSPYEFTAYVEELPGANTQGATFAEAKDNLVEAVKLILETNRQLSEELLAGKEIIKERLGTLSV